MPSNTFSLFPDQSGLLTQSFHTMALDMDGDRDNK